MGRPLVREKPEMMQHAELGRDPLGMRARPIGEDDFRPGSLSSAAPSAGASHTGARSMSCTKSKKCSGGKACSRIRQEVHLGG